MHNLAEKQTNTHVNTTCLMEATAWTANTFHQHHLYINQVTVWAANIFGQCDIYINQPKAKSAQTKTTSSSAMAERLCDASSSTVRGGPLFYWKEIEFLFKKKQKLAFWATL